MTFFATVMVALLMCCHSTVKAAMVVPVSTLQNIFVTGGSSQVDGFEDRLHAEVLAMRPFQSEFRVWSAGELVWGWGGSAGVGCEVGSAGVGCEVGSSGMVWGVGCGV